MQWLSLLFSFFLGKFNVSRPPSLKDSVAFVFEEAAYRSRKPAVLILGGLACVLLLCGGFFMGLIDLTTQMDREGVVRASASAVSGFVLVALALGVFFWIFTRAWPGARHAKEKQAEKEASPGGLEQALTLLVMDFIKEREIRRAERREDREERHHPHTPPLSETPERTPPPLH
jgi:hypothetical protein